MDCAEALPELPRSRLRSGWAEPTTGRGTVETARHCCVTSAGGCVVPLPLVAVTRRGRRGRTGSCATAGAVYPAITRPYFVGVGAGAATFTGWSFAVNQFGLAPCADAVHAGRLPIALMARLPRPLATAYRGFWQAYTGRIGRRSSYTHPDELLDRRSVRAALAMMQRMGWVTPEGGGHRLTPRGCDRYHDLERWVTYVLIEPLWTKMMAEHERVG